jgi:membrane dipeptidase
MLLIDGHLDLGWNAVNWNRDLTQTVAAIRASEAGDTEKGRGTGTVAFPEMRSGEVAVSLATVLARAKPNGHPLLDYKTQEIAYGAAQGQLAYYRAMERVGAMRMLRDAAGLKAHLEEWKTAPATAPLGIILSMEGADPVVDPAHVQSWWDDGLRVLSLAHYGPSAYAHGTNSSGLVTERGRELLAHMAKIGMILDMTHLADESFWDALERFPGRLVATHNNCRTLVPHCRQFADEQVKALAARDAVIGMAFDTWMLKPNWKAGEEVSITTVVDQIDYVRKLTGTTRHIAIGSDLDGGYGTEQSPKELGTIAGIQQLIPMLRERDYSEAEIEGIFYGNWTRLFLEALPQ